MPSLEEELLSDQDPRVRCGVCDWLDKLGEKENPEWDKAINAKVGDRFRFTHASIHRALQRREAPIRRSTVEHHRQNGHRR